jgi:hypothetical protein
MGPLEKRFEQQIHVHHRLRRHGAGRRLDYRDCWPEALSAISWTNGTRYRSGCEKVP